MSEDRFQELKEKYVSVLNVLNREKLHVEKMHVANNKLFIRAIAPSEDAKNKFWDAVKTANANYSQDFQAEISVAPQQAPAPKPAPAPSASAAQQPQAPTAGASTAAQQTYTVQRGDTLSAIAKKFYGNANEYHRIFEANRDQLKDPDKIMPGQVLKIPEAVHK